MTNTTNIDLNTDDHLLQIIQSTGAKDNKERVTLLYLAIDYIFMHDKELKKDRKTLITEH